MCLKGLVTDAFGSSEPFYMRVMSVPFLHRAKKYVRMKRPSQMFQSE